MWFIQKDALLKTQSGFRRSSSTAEPIVRLEPSIHQTFPHNLSLYFLTLKRIMICCGSKTFYINLILCALEAMCWGLSNNSWKNVHFKLDITIPFPVFLLVQMAPHKEV